MNFLDSNFAAEQGEIETNECRFIFSSRAGDREGLSSSPPLKLQIFYTSKCGQCIRGSSAVRLMVFLFTG